MGMDYVTFRTILFGLLFHFAFLFSHTVGLASGELSFDGISLKPLSRVAPGGVLVLQARVANLGDALAEGTIVVSVEEFPKTQSARRVVLEPGQHTQLDLFVSMPENFQGLKSIHITATLMIRSGERQVILERNGTPVQHALAIDVGSGRSFAMALPSEPLKKPDWYWPQELPPTDYEFAIAARIESGNDRTAASFDNRSVPLNQADWAGLDLFVISDPNVLVDGAFVESLRRYVASGGRLWIMLDLVPCTLVRPLLGTNQLCEEIERVELNDFAVNHVGTIVQHSEQERRVVSETDLLMVRVLQEGGRVRFDVEGWPAAIEMNIGYGQILLTTLDSRAWIEPSTKKSTKGESFQSSYQPRVWAKYFSVDANESRSLLPLTERVDYPLSQIGNPVVPRKWVAVALIGFFVVLAVLGLWFAYIKRLTAIGWLVPIATILLSIGLVSAANWVRRDIPESLSRFQMVELNDDGNFAHIREQSAVYLGTAASMLLASSQDGTPRSDETVTSGVPRFVQEDFQKWSLANEAWPPGVWRYDAEAILPTPQIVARGVLSNTGLHLRLPADVPWSLENPILSFATGDPMLCDPSDGGFLVNNTIHVEGDRWISGSLLSDEQQRRLEIYRTFFQSNNKMHRPTRRLFGWTPPWNYSHWNRDLKQIGSALVSMPIELERPMVGSEVFVPHGLIRLQRNLSNVSLTASFDDRTGVWRKENSAGADLGLQFVLPEEIVPFAAKAIVLELDIRAPQRDVSVAIRTKSGFSERFKLESPSIPWSETITDVDVLESARDGILEVQMKISESRIQKSQGLMATVIPWHVDHFHVNMRGSVSAKSSLSNTNP